MKLNFDRFYMFLHYYEPRSIRFFAPIYTSFFQERDVTRSFSEWMEPLVQMGMREARYRTLRERWEHFNVDAYVQQLHRARITLVPYFHRYYPPLLKTVYDAPALLYAKGELRELASPSFAIVGSRRATSYSEKALHELVPRLNSLYNVTSGLAIGADAMAHERALSLRMKTVAVLGHGFAHMYPARHRALCERITRSGVVITEYPPYVKPQRWTFPKRNRIIAGMSEGVLVTEAQRKSGTMSTIDYALQHGRTIYALIGRYDDPLSEGPNILIEQGAIPVISASQFEETVRKEAEINRQMYDNS